jgi:mannose-6-phosphate isomerase-like protein (cupin superfamily)
MTREVIVSAISDLPGRTGSHGRTRDLTAKGFPFECGVPGIDMEFTWVYVPEGYATPRHKHCFDQLRYIVEGEFGVGKGFEIETGQCAYFPEGVDYGPQHQDAGCTTLILQFPGPTLTPYLTHAELHRAQRELEAAGGEFENGIYTRYTADGRKFNMDSHRACWEYLTEKEEVFPKGRYRHPVVMIPEAAAWVPDRRLPGVEHKHLGTFGEFRTGVSLIRLAPGAKLPALHQEDAEIRYLLEGSTTYGGKRWLGGTSEEAGTYFYLPHDCDVGETSSPDGALFYRIALPMIAEAELKQKREAEAVRTARVA